MGALNNQKLRLVVETFEHFMKFHKNSKRYPMASIKDQGTGWYLSTHLGHAVPAAPNRSFARAARKGVKIGNNGKMTKCRRKHGSLVRRVLKID